MNVFVDYASHGCRCCRPRKDRSGIGQCNTLAIFILWCLGVPTDLIIRAMKNQSQPKDASIQLVTFGRVSQDIRLE